MTPRNMGNIGSPMKRSRDKIGLPPLQTIVKKTKKINLKNCGDEQSVESMEDRAKRNLMMMNDDEVDEMDLEISANK